MKVRVLRYGLHRGEEPIVWGNERSGMIVLSGCHLRCSFCYTPETSVLRQGTDKDEEAFMEMMAELLSLGARNISLISPTHVWGTLEPWLTRYKQGPGRYIPLVLKISGFESPAIIRRMAKVADVIIPDFKVFSSERALSVDLPKNYGPVAAKAIEVLQETHGEHLLEDGLIRRGIVVRHLLMPGFDDDSMHVLQALAGFQYRSYVNFMTCYVSPKKGLERASQARVEQLALQAELSGMHFLFDAQRRVA